MRQSRLEAITETHSMNRHLEDLDRSKNITQKQIKPVLQKIFNNVLERDTETQISFEQSHRALRPKGSEDTPSRDIICCLSSFTIKEDILNKARQNELIDFNGDPVKLFHDLPPITLNNTRALHLLLEFLKENSLYLRCKFPFDLQVTSNGKQYCLRMPHELYDFCKNLRLPQVE